MRSTSHIDKLNKKNMKDTRREDYMRKIDEMVKARKKAKWCQSHPTGKWEDNYMRCRIGFIRGEDCIEGPSDE